MNKYKPTGVDQTTTVLLSFPTSTPLNVPNSSSHGVAMTAFAVALPLTLTALAAEALFDLRDLFWAF